MPEVTLKFKSFDEFKQFMAKEFEAHKASMSVPTEEIVANTKKNAETKTTTAKKKAATKKEEAPEPTPEPTEAPKKAKTKAKKEEPAKESGVTFEDIREALIAVSSCDSLGLPAVKKLLKEFDVSHASELKKGQYEGFLAAAKAKVA